MQRRIAAPTFLASVLLGLVPCGVANAQWTPAGPHSVGINPVAAAPGDLNADGIPDLVVANRNSGDLSVLLGAGGGAFAAQTTFRTGFTPVGVALGDMDGDGRLDAVSANLTGATVSIHLGDGAGGLGPPSSTFVGPATYAPGALALGDLNGDGRLDVVTSDPWVLVTTVGVSVMLGDGAGNVGSATVYSVAGNPTTILLGDLNGDGALDSVTPAGDFAWLAIRLGTGTGTFGSQSTVSLTTNLRHAALGDVNGDGRLDVVGISGTIDRVSVSLGTGTGSFGPAALYVSGSDSRKLSLGDANGDGAVDAVVARPFFDSIEVLAGNGSGGFGAPSAQLAGTQPQWAALADLDSDGRLDVAVPSYSTHDVSVLLNAALPHAGTAAFGAGTSGCSGRLGIAAASFPKVGNARFGFATTNAPRLALGLGLVTDAQDLAGSDPFGLGLLLHVSFAAKEVFGLDARSDPSGTGFVAAPIPNTPALAGQSFFAQTIWVEPAGFACSPAVASLVSSRGLSLTIQP